MIYREVRVRLDEELGLEPSADLQRLRGRSCSRTRAWNCARGTRRIVPVPPTPLIGRRDELGRARGRGWLHPDLAPLLTLTGPGGTGKTRLAHRARPSGLTADFLDGVFFVELAAISDPMLLVPTIAGVLELPEERLENPQQTLSQALRERELLLVLDNLEQLPGAAPLLAELLSTCPRLVLLVTSRSPLHLSGERLYPLEPLPASDALALLVARAQAANPGFAPTAENHVALAAICARLDGLPLALELAAARLKLLSPEALLLRLERSLELLVDGARDLPERQQALRSTIAWSDGLLSPSEQSFFHRLAVFRGGCMLEAAEAVCNPLGELGDTLTLAETLVDASLIHARPETDGEHRLDLLQTIRDYAAEALADDGDEALVRDRHGDYFLSLAEQAEPHLNEPDQALWIARIEQEQDNFREALAFAANTGETSRELRIAGSLGFFWSVRGRHLAEGRRHLDGALARAGSSAEEPRAKALRQNAWIAIRQGQLDDARSLAEEATEIYRSLGDASGTHNTLDALAVVLIETGEVAKARPVLEESLALARTLGNKNYVAATLNNLASLALAERQYERAQELANESLEHFSEQRISYGSAIALYNIGAAQAQQGAFVQAFPNLQESLRLSVELGDDEGIIFGLEALALLTAEAGEAALASELLGCAEARGQEIGLKRAQFEQLMYDSAVVAVRERVPDEDVTRSWAAGRSMTIEDAVASIVSREPSSHAQPVAGSPGTSVD